MKNNLFFLLCISLLGCISNNNLQNNANANVKIIDNYEAVLEDEKNAENILQNLLKELNGEKYIYFDNPIDLLKDSIDNFDYSYELIDIRINRQDIRPPAPPILEFIFKNDTGITQIKSWQLFTDEAYDKNINQSYLYISSKNVIELFNSRSGIKGYNIRRNNLPAGAYLIKTFIPSYLEYIGLQSGRLFIRQDVSKIIRNCLEIGDAFTPFYWYELYTIPQSLFEIIQGKRINESLFVYLVLINDNSYSYFKPFYIETNKQLRTMRISGKELIFEEVEIRYLRNENYYDNGMEKNTFYFQQRQEKNTTFINDFEIDSGLLIAYRGNGGIVNVPIYVNEIGFIAFELSKGEITTINIPFSVSKIENISDSYTSNLQNINVSPLNPYFLSLNGILFSKDLKNFIKYPANIRNREYIFPNGVEKISDRAFGGNRYITMIKFPETLKTIGLASFQQCINLETIEFNNDLIEIGMLAFSYCSKLNNLIIPSSVLKIGNYAFSNCTNLKSVRISRRTQLGELVFPEGAIIEYYD